MFAGACCCGGRLPPPLLSSPSYYRNKAQSNPSAIQHTTPQQKNSKIVYWMQPLIIWTTWDPPPADECCCCFQPSVLSSWMEPQNWINEERSYLVCSGNWADRRRRSPSSSGRGRGGLPRRAQGCAQCRRRVRYREGRRQRLLVTHPTRRSASPLRALLLQTWGSWRLPTRPESPRIWRKPPFSACWTSPDPFVPSSAGSVHPIHRKLLYSPPPHHGSVLAAWFLLQQMVAVGGDKKEQTSGGG
jgi:hypothetical protein